MKKTFRIIGWLGVMLIAVLLVFIVFPNGRPTADYNDQAFAYSNAKETAVFITGMPPMEWALWDFISAMEKQNIRIFVFSPTAYDCPFDEIGQWLVCDIKTYGIKRIDYLIAYSAGAGFLESISKSDFDIRQNVLINPVGLVRQSPLGYLANLTSEVWQNLSWSNFGSFQAVVHETAGIFFGDFLRYNEINQKIILGYPLEKIKYIAKQAPTIIIKSWGDKLIPFQETRLNALEAGIKQLDIPGGHFFLFDNYAAAADKIVPPYLSRKRTE